jgi:glycosyltransferase involved in cell wall biosynthesis
MNTKIGVGIITCDRPDYFKKLIKSLEGISISDFYIINDGEKQINGGGVKTHNNIPPKQGVGKAKNQALRYLKDCDYIFLLEDDIIIKDKTVFAKYIEASKISGIQHFNFAFHGVDNYFSDGSPAVRLKLDYSPTVSVSLYPNVYGAFSMYTKKCIEEAGLMDEFYYNAMEHVDHTTLIIKANMHPPFRWFADITNSHKYIEEIDRAHSGSEIRRDQKWIENFCTACNYFTQKHGFDVRDPHATVASKEETINAIKQIKNKYGQK